MQTTPTVIYIEDDVEDWEIFGHVLQSLNLDLNIVHIPDGHAGLNYLLERKEKKKLPALIILDINMPKINGIELLRIMKADDVLKNIPSLVLSTSINERNEVASMGVELIQKPGEIQHFSQSVKQFFESINIQQNS